MPKPWPRFITPNADPLTMRPDPGAPKPATQWRWKPRPARASSHFGRELPGRAEANVALKASTNSDGTPRPGYAMRVRHLRAVLRTHDALDAAKAAPIAPIPKTA